MISFVRAYSLEEARSILVYSNARRQTDLRAYPDHVAWIGLEPRGPSPVRRRNSEVCRKSLVVQLDDVDPSVAVAILLGERGDRANEARENARRIVSFLEEVHAEPASWAVAIHCTLGIGRSGAVSRYVQDRWKPMEEQRWGVMHSRCEPRKWLLKLLKEAEGV